MLRTLLAFTLSVALVPTLARAQELPVSDASEMRGVIELYSADRAGLNHYFGVREWGAHDDSAASPERRARMKQFYDAWLARLKQTKFDTLSQAGRVDYLLFRNLLQHELDVLQQDGAKLNESEPLVPFRAPILALSDARRKMQSVDAPKAAATVAQIKTQVAELRRKIEAELKKSDAERPAYLRKSVAYRAAVEADALRATLKHWYTFGAGYDAQFTWWLESPQKEADKALGEYATWLKERVVGLKADDKETITGDAIGREAVMAELRSAMIPYTPEELIEIGNAEYAWCEREMKRASKELGYGDDWMKALEHVKQKYVAPGEQPALIRRLALEAEKFIDDRGLVTVPALAKENWRMEMMSPERQLVNPFFLGGEDIIVSYPTNTMTHEQKLMSMRGNNPYFSHATVFHELIPGHHLQGFMAERYKAYRGIFDTPFLVEGWALYWEMLLWDQGFNATPEERIGALFWRMHRCARITFSLSFHLGKMTPQECVDFLVNKVGHERDNAAGEVRRSFAGDYGPLYQIGYMIGGLQIRAMHKELVDSGKMTNRAFHDAILRENNMPIELLRAALTGQKLTEDFQTSWRFYDLKAAH